MPLQYTKVSRNGVNLVEILFTRWNVPEIPFGVALAGCFTCGALYAAVLTTQWGQEKTLSHVWIAGFVVFGVAMVLAWIATQPPHTAIVDLAFFAAGGASMIVRAIYLWNRHKQQVIAHLQQRAQQASTLEFED